MRLAIVTVTILLLLAMAGYVATCIFLYRNQARFLFPGAFLPIPPEIAARGTQFGLQTRVIPAADGTGLFALTAAPAPGKPVIILFHGNGSYPEDYGFLYGDWISAGYGIIAQAARGYPRSGGTPDGAKMLSDALAIYDWSKTTFAGHPVQVVGQSLGTAPAVHLAASRPVAGVVLISPFLSMTSLVQGKFPYLPVSLLLVHPFRSDLDMPQIEAPILIVHGERDTLVPIGSARALAKLARAPLTFSVVRDAGHNSGLFTADTIAQIDTALGIYTH